MALIITEEERMDLPIKNDTSIKGKLAIANRDYIKDDYIWGGNPFSYSRLGFTKRTGNCSKGMVIGRCTGNRGNGLTEVRLFNPVWQYNGQPNYYFQVYDELTIFMDDDTARLQPRPVFKDFYPRDLVPDYTVGLEEFPNVDNDYKDVCWNYDFTKKVHWKETDAYFLNADWYTEYIKFFMPWFLNDKQSLDKHFKYTGPDFNPRDINKKFIDFTESDGIIKVVSGKSTKNSIIAGFSIKWNGCTPDIGDIGLCWSDTNTLPTKDDNFLVRSYTTSPNHYFEFNINYINNDKLNSNTLVGLIPNTNYYIRAWANDLNGVPYYSIPTTIKTKAAIETINLQLSVFNITNTSVELTARILNTMLDSYPTKHGIKFGTSLDNMQDLVLDNDNSYWKPGIYHYYMKCTPNALQSNTKYYVYAYVEYEGITTVTNKYTTEIPYGTDGKWLTWGEINENYITTKEVPGKAKVIEALPYNITESKATIKGQVINNGGNLVTEYGFVWSDTNTIPTVENSIESNIKRFYGENFEYYTHDLEGLKPNTTYYFRTYAKNGMGYSYNGLSFGKASNFTTTGEISILTNPATNITLTTALITSTIKKTSNLILTNKGVCWSLNTNPTINNNSKESTLNQSEFSIGLDNLVSGKTYYAKSYMIFSNGDKPVYYGNEISFNTSVVPSKQTPSVSTLPCFALSTNNITTGYKIINSGSSALIDKGVGLSSTELINNINDFDATFTGNDNSPISIDISNLTIGDTYYLTSYAKNYYGADIGNTISFIVPEEVIIPDIEGFELTQNINIIDNNLIVTINSNDSSAILTDYKVYISKSSTLDNTTISYASKSNKFTIPITLDENIYIYSEAKLGDKIYLSEYSNITTQNYTPNSSIDSLKIPVNPTIGDNYIFNEDKKWKYSSEGWVKDRSITNTNINNIGSNGLQTLKIVDSKKVIAKDKFIYSDMGQVNYYLKLWLDIDSPFVENERVTLKFGDVVLENLYQIIDIDNSSLITIHFPELEINGQIFPQTNNINLLENTIYDIEVYSYTEENKQILTPINNAKFRQKDIDFGILKEVSGTVELVGITDWFNVLDPRAFNHIIYCYNNSVKKIYFTYFVEDGAEWFWCDDNNAILPQLGITYIYNNKPYIWNGTDLVNMIIPKFSKTNVHEFQIDESGPFNVAVTVGEITELRAVIETQAGITLSSVDSVLENNGTIAVSYIDIDNGSGIPSKLEVRIMYSYDPETGYDFMINDVIIFGTGITASDYQVRIYTK